NADILIIDELDGRSEAKNLGLRVTGMLGIFKLAKQRNYISAVTPYLNKLRLTNFKLRSTWIGNGISSSKKMGRHSRSLTNTSIRTLLLIFQPLLVCMISSGIFRYRVVKLW